MTIEPRLEPDDPYPRSRDPIPFDVEFGLEIFRQAHTNARAHMDMRNRHFSTFLVVSGLLITVAINFDGYVSDAAPPLGIVMTALYWLMDRRMVEYQRHFQLIAQRSQERVLGSVDAPPKARWLRANTISNLIFVIIVLLWIVLLTLVVAKYYSPFHWDGILIGQGST